MIERFKCENCGHVKKFNKRSLNQNAFIHLLFGKIADHTGYSFDETKCMMKLNFGYYKEGINRNTGETFIVYDETSKMTVAELSEFTEKVLLFANSELQLEILSPEEFYQT